MKRPEQDLFESARHVPVELSQTQVAGIIKGLVLLPVPPPPPTSFNWLHFLTSKPIIMNSLIISLVVSSLVFFQQVEEEPPPMVEQQEELAISELEETETLSSSPISMEETTPETRPLKQYAALLPPATQAQEELGHESHSTEQSKETRETLMPSLTFLSQKNQSPPLSTGYVQNPVLPSTTPIASASSEKTDVVRSYNVAKIKGGKLKKKLLNQLTKDGLIADKKSGVKMEVFQDRLIVNERELSPSLEYNYRKILNKHHVQSGRYSQIRISPTFIIVGDFNPDGFRGMMQGAVNTDTVEGFKPIQSEGGLMSIAAAQSDHLFPVVMDTEVSGIARIGTTTSILPRIAASSYPVNGESMSIIYPENPEARPEIATPLFPLENPMEGLVDIEEDPDDTWTDLKEELLYNLRRDGLIEGNHSPVLLAHTSRQILVNEQKLKDRLRDKYRMILLTYSVSSGPKTQIHITPDYILVGDFDKNGHMISGHATGKMKLHDKTDRIIGLKMH